MREFADNQGGSAGTRFIVAGRGRGEGGFTLFELAVVAVVVGILAAMLLKRVLFYLEAAERVAAQQVAGTLRSALNLQVARLMVKGREREIAGLAAQNPMDWLAQKPGNYRGEFYGPTPDQIGLGNWYFDRTGKKLVYLFKNIDTSSNIPENKLIFKVKLISIEKGVNRSANEDGSIEGIILDQVVQ